MLAPWKAVWPSVEAPTIRGEVQAHRGDGLGSFCISPRIRVVARGERDGRSGLSNCILFRGRFVPDARPAGTFSGRWRAPGAPGLTVLECIFSTVEWICRYFRRMAQLGA